MGKLSTSTGLRHPESSLSTTSSRPKTTINGLLRKLVLLYMLCSQLPTCTAWLPLKSFKGNVADVAPLLALDMNISTLLRHKPHGVDAIHTQVNRDIEQVRAKSTCSKRAVHHLVRTCRALGAGPEHAKQTSVSLETARSVYAARMAVCTLREARIAAPSSCNKIMPAEVMEDDIAIHGASDPWRGSPIEQINTDHLAACVHDIGGQGYGQAWTSYDSNRNQAATVCQISRSDFESEGLLDLYRYLTDVNVKLSEAQEAMLARFAASQEAQLEYARSIKREHQDASEEVKNLQRAGSSALRQTWKQVNDTLHSAAVKARISLQKVDDQATHTHQKLQDTKAHAAHLEQGLQNIYRTALSGTSELAAINQADAERNQHVAAAVRELLSDFAVQIGLMAADVDDVHQQTKEMKQDISSIRGFVKTCMAVIEMCTLERLALLAFALAFCSVWTRRKPVSPLQILMRVSLGLIPMCFVDIWSLVPACLSSKRKVLASQAPSRPLDSDLLWPSLLVLSGIVLGIGFYALFYALFQRWASTAPPRHALPSSASAPVTNPSNINRPLPQSPTPANRIAEENDASPRASRVQDRTWKPAQGISIAQRSPDVKQVFSQVATTNFSRRRAVRQSFKKAQSEPATREPRDFSSATSCLLTPSATP